MLTFYFDLPTVYLITSRLMSAVTICGASFPPLEKQAYVMPAGGSLSSTWDMDLSNQNIPQFRLRDFDSITITSLSDVARFSL